MQPEKTLEQFLSEMKEMHKPLTQQKGVKGNHRKKSNIRKRLKEAQESKPMPQTVGQFMDALARLSLINSQYAKEATDTMDRNHHRNIAQFFDLLIIKLSKVEGLASASRSLANSVMAHPDCEQGSEFGDLTEHLLEELKEFEVA